MVDLNDASVQNLGAPVAGDRFLVQRTGTARGYVDGSQLAAGAGAAVRQNVTSFAGGDITTQLQNAVNSGVPIAMPAGRHTLNAVIDIPTGGVDLIGAGDGNRMSGGTVIQGAPGADIFRAQYSNQAQARPAGGNQVTLGHFGLTIDPNGANTRNNQERCTTTGYGIGTCGIVYERTDWPTETTGTRSISDAWNTSHSRIHNITCDVLNASAIDHGTGLFHSQGNTYGSRWHDLDSAGGQSSTRRGCHSLLTVAQPYVHRVTCDAGTDRINAATGSNQFLNDQQVMIRAHDATGTRPAGIDFDTVYHVVNRNGTSFQISATQGGGAVNITSNGTGLIYAILVGNAGAVFSPVVCYIDRVSHYNGKMGISVCNPERLWLANVTSYAIETILEIPGVLSTTSRTQAVSTSIHNIYSESPQAIAGNANSECILVESDGLAASMIQMRGADTGSQPIAKFTGNDHTITSFDGRSSFGQGGVDLRIEATNSMITGQCHDTSTVATQADTVGRLRRAGGAGFFFQRNFV